MVSQFLKLFFLIVIFWPWPGLAVREFSEGNNLDLKITPENPQPGDYVSIDVSSYGLNIDTAAISWYINGQLNTSGLGLKNFKTKLSTDKNTLVLVKVSQEGQDSQSLLVFDQGTVDLLWETNTTVPLGYKGKALISSGAEVKIVAISNLKDRQGKFVPREQINFQWKINNKQRPDLSGVGKDSIKIVADLSPNPDKISVEATSLDNFSSAKNTLILPLVKPEIVLYRSHPTEGTDYSQALSSTFSSKDSLATIKAEPFYFVNRSGLIYNWLVNSQVVPNDNKDPSRLLIQTKNNFNGPATIDLEITDPKVLFQNAKIRTIVNLNQSNFKF